MFAAKEVEGSSEVQRQDMTAQFGNFPLGTMKATKYEFETSQLAQDEQD